MEGLVALVDLFLTDTYRYSDRPHSAFPEYIPRLLTSPTVTVREPDIRYSLPAERVVEIVISNFDLGTFVTGAPSISSILKAQKPMGKAVRIRYYDPDIATVVFQLEATITEVGDLNQRQARLLAQEFDTDAMQKNVPAFRAQDRFPSIDLSSTPTEDPTEIIPFGVMRRVDLALCHKGIWSVQYVFPNTLADNFRFDDLSNITNYLVQPGDYLYYDVFWIGTGQFFGLELQTFDGLILGVAGEVDQNNLGARITTDLWPRMSDLGGHWYRRKIKLDDSWVGKTVSLYLIGCQANAAGTYGGWLSNAFIGDTYGNIHKYILTPETGQPTTALFVSADGANGAPTVVFNNLYDYGPIRPATGACIQFPSSSGLSITNPNKFPVGLGCTFEAYVRTGGVSAGIATRFFSAPQRWALFIAASGFLTLWIDTTTGSFAVDIPFAPLNTNTWRYVGMTIDNVAKVARLYLDSSFTASVAFSGTFGDTGGSFLVGATIASLATPMIGSVDEVRFWGKVRTTTELQHINNTMMPLTGTEAGLYGYWPCDELLVAPLLPSVMRDWTGRGNHATIVTSGVAGVGAISAIRVVTAYSDGRVISDTDWGFATFLASFVRFPVDKRDVSGRLMRIQADLFSLEFDQNFAAAENFVLSNAVYGLGYTTSTSAFLTAATTLRTEGYTVGHGLFQQVAVGEILRFLHVRGAYIRRNASNEWELIIDTAAQHTLTAESLGQVDGYWENCEIRGQRQLSLSQRIHSLTLHGMFDRGFSGSGSYLAAQLRTRVERGRDETIRNAFLGDVTTTDKEADYIFKSLVSLDTQLEVQTFKEFVGQDIRKLTSVFSPNMDFDGDIYQILQWQLRGPQLIILFGGWDPLLFTYAAGKINPDARALSITDFSATFPAQPSGVTAVPNGIRTGSNGATIEAFILATGTAPASNESHLIARLFQPGSIVYQHEIIVAAGPSEAKSMRFAVAPGLLFDCHVLVRNGANAPGFQDGVPVVVSNVLSSGDTTAPPVPSNIVLRQTGAKVVEIVVTFAEPDDWGLLEVYRNTVNSIGGGLVDTGKKKLFHDQGITYGATLYYSARAKDYSGNYSGFSSVYSIAIARLGSDDYGGGTVNGTHITGNTIAAVHMQANSIASVSIQANAITNAHIQANAIATANVQADAIGTVNITADAITTVKINANAVTSGKRQHVATLTAAYSILASGSQQINFSHSIGRIPLVTANTNNSAVESSIFNCTSTQIFVVLRNNATGITSSGTLEIFFW